MQGKLSARKIGIDYGIDRTLRRDLPVRFKAFQIIAQIFPQRRAMQGANDPDIQRRGAPVVRTLGDYLPFSFVLAEAPQP